jgi:hypothetical protein
MPAVLAVLIALPARSDEGSPENAAPRGRLVAATLTLVALATFSVVGTRDYMQHHRTRNALLDELMASGVDVSRIDGGFEFNGFHSLTRLPGLEISRQWFYTNSNEYVLTDLEHMGGYEVIDSGSFERLMPPGTETLRVLRRLPQN